MKDKRISTTTTIDEIKQNPKNVIKLYRSKLGKRFTIEIETKNPIAFTSLIYTKEIDRDADYLTLDTEVFELLDFNPYTTPPHVPLPPLPPLYTPPSTPSNRAYDDVRKIFLGIF